MMAMTKDSVRNRIALMTRVLMILIIPGGVLAQEVADSNPGSADKTKAPKLVRRGNELLRGAKPGEALIKYEEAQALRPDAHEIRFDQGLAHFQLGDFEGARDAFSEVAAGSSGPLADEAQYGLGTCEHAEALAAKDPREAISKIEEAMRNYQNVLAHQPEHALARDAHFKAASYWRQLKQQLQQQPQQQDQVGDQEQQDQQDQQQKQQNPQEQQQNQSQDQEQQQPQQNQQQQSSQEQPQPEQETSGEPKEQEQEQEQPAESREQETREQAERRLREMMQALRDRKKMRREEVKTPPFRPAEKDW